MRNCGWGSRTLPEDGEAACARDYCPHFSRLLGRTHRLPLYLGATKLSSHPGARHGFRAGRRLHAFDRRVVPVSRAHARRGRLDSEPSIEGHASRGSELGRPLLECKPPPARLRTPMHRPEAEARPVLQVERHPQPLRTRRRIRLVCLLAPTGCSRTRAILRPGRMAQNALDKTQNGR